ncbi:MAG: Crp/Fnr family transcriptional regulator [Rhodospirillales bacterium]|nr:Crp/Fnr family transcriptional regulator [Rhodospirillales bacterium]
MPSLLPTPAAAINRRILKKGEALFYQGDQTFAIFAVRRGRVRLVRHLADGGTVPLHVAHDGETFSEAALFSRVYHCDAFADMDSEIEIHPKDALSKALDENPQAARSFMMHLAHQVIDLRSRLEVRNIRSAEDRVFQFLQLTADDAERSITFARPLKDIAGDIGLTHEVFYRTLAKLEKSGLITRIRRTITLLDQA